ncbi:UDP-N-acetyl-D-mannosamine dehydrogenase, partial [Mannheimia haemolytica]|uniref:UDP binding domain-containing protein n=1 Tax=Mannheimia haemolytica TaxID=75985 RepID=UPI0011938EA1
KPDIDDLRESPALKITEKLAEKYPNQVFAVEPNVEELPKKLANKNISLISVDEALEVADVVVVLVDHSEFKLVKPVFLNDICVVDTKGTWT